MNILILNWRDPKHPLAGGAELSLLEHAKYWQKNGANITWFSSYFENSVKEELINGIKYIRRGSHFTVHIYFLIYILKNKNFIKEIDKIIDCFHFLPFFTPIFISKKKIIALINEVAGKVWYLNLPYFFANLGYYVEPLFFKIYKDIQFITASNSTKEELLSLGILEKNINIISHGVTEVKVDPKIKKELVPTFIFLGRVSRDKGIVDVLSAYEIVKLKLPNARLWIVGKEENEGYLESLLNSKFKGINKDIKHYGFVNQKTKFELLKRSWLLLHASVKEGWGLTVIEAASQKTPTVGYNVEGLKDSIKHGKTGILVTSNPQALANGVSELIQNKNEFEKICTNAKTWSKKFDWEKSGEKSWRYIIQER